MLGIETVNASAEELELPAEMVAAWLRLIQDEVLEGKLCYTFKSELIVKT